MTDFEAQLAQLDADITAVSERYEVVQHALRTLCDSRRVLLNDYFMSEFESSSHKLSVVFDDKFVSITDDAAQTAHDYVYTLFHGWVYLSGQSAFTGQNCVQLCFLEEQLPPDFVENFKAVADLTYPIPDATGIYGDIPNNEMVGKRYFNIMEPSYSANGSYSVYLDAHDAMYVGIHTWGRFSIEKVADNIADGLQYLAKRFCMKDRL